MKKRWWKRSLVIQPALLHIPASIPCNSKGDFTIQKKREHKPKALEAVSRLTLRMSEIRLERIEIW